MTRTRHSTRRKNQNTTFALHTVSWQAQRGVKHETMVERQGADAKDSQVEKRLLFHNSDYDMRVFLLVCLQFPSMM